MKFTTRMPEPDQELRTTASPTHNGMKIKTIYKSDGTTPATLINSNEIRDLILICANDTNVSIGKALFGAFDFFGAKTFTGSVTVKSSATSAVVVQDQSGTGTASITGAGAITGTSVNAGSGAITGGAITGTSLGVGSGAISTTGTISGGSAVLRIVGSDALSIYNVLSNGTATAKITSAGAITGTSLGVGSGAISGGSAVLRIVGSDALSIYNVLSSGTATAKITSAGAITGTSLGVGSGAISTTGTITGGTITGGAITGTSLSVGSPFPYAPAAPNAAKVAVKGQMYFQGDVETSYVTSAPNGSVSYAGRNTDASPIVITETRWGVVGGYGITGVGNGCIVEQLLTGKSNLAGSISPVVTRAVMTNNGTANAMPAFVLPSGILHVGSTAAIDTSCLINATTTFSGIKYTNLENKSNNTVSAAISQAYCGTNGIRLVAPAPLWSSESAGHSVSGSATTLHSTVGLNIAAGGDIGIYAGGAVAANKRVAIGVASGVTINCHTASTGALTINNLGGLAVASISTTGTITGVRVDTNALNIYSSSVTASITTAGVITGTSLSAGSGAISTTGTISGGSAVLRIVDNDALSVYNVLSNGTATAKITSAGAITGTSLALGNGTIASGAISIKHTNTTALPNAIAVYASALSTTVNASIEPNGDINCISLTSTNYVATNNVICGSGTIGTNTDRAIRVINSGTETARVNKSGAAAFASIGIGPISAPSTVAGIDGAGNIYSTASIQAQGAGSSITSGGTLAVTGLTTLSGGLNVASGSSDFHGNITVYSGTTAKATITSAGAITGTSLGVGSGAITGGAITGTSLGVGSGAISTFGVISGGSLQIRSNGGSIVAGIDANGVVTGSITANNLSLNPAVVSPDHIEMLMGAYMSKTYPSQTNNWLRLQFRDNAGLQVTCDKTLTSHYLNAELSKSKRSINGADTVFYTAELEFYQYSLGEVSTTVSFWLPLSFMPNGTTACTVLNSSGTVDANSNLSSDQALGAMTCSGISFEPDGANYIAKFSFTVPACGGVHTKIYRAKVMFTQ